MKINTREKLKLIIKVAKSKKADSPLILDLNKVSNICDYFVIVSAESSKRVETIADAIKEELEKNGFKIAHYDGNDACLWVLLDAYDVIVHVFRSDIREFYALERLWSSAAEVETEDVKE